MFKKKKILEVSAIVFNSVTRLLLSNRPSPRDDDVQLEWETDLMERRVRPEEDTEMASYRRRGMVVKSTPAFPEGEGARHRTVGRGRWGLLRFSKRQSLMQRAWCWDGEGGGLGSRASSVSGKSCPSLGLT